VNMTQRLWLLIVCASGCSAELTHELDPASTAEPLYIQSNSVIREPFIPVCWEPTPLPNYDTALPMARMINPTDPAFAARQQLIRESVESTWNRYTRLVFAGWGTCAAPTDPGIHIVVENGRPPPGAVDPGRWGWPRVADFGLGANGTQTVFFSFDFWNKDDEFEAMFDAAEVLNTSHFASIAVHEFGHLLGFRHEQERSGADTVCAHNLSLDGDYNPIGGNDATLTEAGPFDQNSVMSYCAAGFLNDGRLTNNDVFYTVMTYGKKASGSLVSFDGRCLDMVPRAFTTDIGQTYDCLGGTEFARGETASDNQRFYFVPRTGAMVHANTGAVLDIPNNNPVDGSVVQLYPEVRTPGQQWSLPEVQLRGAGGMCARPVSVASPANSEIEMVTCDPLRPNPVDLFAIQPDGSLRHNNSGLCVQLFGGGGTRVELRVCDPAEPLQQWRLDSNGTITNDWNGSEVCLDMGVRNDLNREFQGVDGANRLQAYTCNEEQNQVFSVAGPVIGMGGKCLNVQGAARGNGTPVDITTCTGAPEQIWELHW
jgi:hypothetical protein